MARIEYTGEIECHEGTWRTVYRFIGIGWAMMHLPDGWRGAFEPVIFEGNLWLRILYVDRGFPGWLCVVEADNWRWPLWWVLLRCHRLLSWFERNLRFTCAIWGLIKGELGVEPLWRNFIGAGRVRRGLRIGVAE